MTKAVVVLVPRMAKTNQQPELCSKLPYGLSLQTGHTCPKNGL